MKNFGLALIAVLLAIVITSMLAMVGLPLLDSATEGLSQSMRSILALVVILILIGMVAGLSMPIYDWQLKRAEQQAELKKQEEDPNFVRKPLIAFVVLGLICVLIYAYEFLVSSDRNTNVPTQIGENLVYALILFTVFTNFLGKHLSKSQKSFSLVVILAVMTSGSVLTSQMRAQADNESLVRIQDNVLSLLEVQESEDGRIAPLEVTSGAGFAQNENEIMEATITAYLNQLIENNNNYVTELEAIGYESLTDGERIQADTDMSESRFILDRTAAIVDKYEQLNE